MFKKVIDTDGITRYVNINHITSFRIASADGLVLNMSNGFTICLDMEIDEFKKLIKGNLWQRIWQKLLSRNYEDRGLQKSRTNSFYHQQT